MALRARVRAGRHRLPAVAAACPRACSGSRSSRGRRSPAGSTGLASGRRLRPRRARRDAVTVVHLHALPLDERMWPGRGGAAPLRARPTRWTTGPTRCSRRTPGELILVGASMGGYCAAGRCASRTRPACRARARRVAARPGLAAAPCEACRDDRARAEAGRRRHLALDARDALPERSRSGARRAARGDRARPHRGRARDRTRGDPRPAGLDRCVPHAWAIAR